MAEAVGLEFAFVGAAVALFRESVPISANAAGELVAGEHQASVPFAFTAWLGTPAGAPFGTRTAQARDEERDGAFVGSRRAPIGTPSPAPIGIRPAGGLVDNPGRPQSDVTRLLRLPDRSGLGLGIATSVLALYLARRTRITPGILIFGLSPSRSPIS